jgi:hypothetical protein
LLGGGKKRPRDDDGQASEGGGTSNAIVDMTQFVLTPDIRDGPVVHDVLNKSIANSLEFVESLSVGGLEQLQELVAASPKHILTDTTIRKYAELLPEMIEVKVHRH